MERDLSGILQEELRRFRACYEGFPFMYCRTAATELAQTRGTLWIKGKYVGPVSEAYRERALTVWRDLDMFTEGFPHDFSYDPCTGLFFDLTARQFTSMIPDIVVLESDSPLIAVDKSEIDAGTTHYIEKVHWLRKERGVYLPYTIPCERKQGRVDIGFNPLYDTDVP